MFVYFWIIVYAVLTPVLSEIIKIDQGFINGTILYSRNDHPFHAFYGIPYAAPPVGSLRFEPPAKPPTWSDVRQAIKPSSPCLQYMAAVPGLRQASFFGSEDCLYINVFTREINPKQLQPVLVYLHGGAFRSGNAITYGPHLFMDKSVVMVSFNHRLGLFGYLSSGDNVLPGNYGLKDQVMALKWIQENISKFGGNPKSVTILGHNSGATCAHLHTISPLSKGFFRRIIMQSGNAIQYLKNNSTSRAKNYFTEALTSLNCQRNTTEESLSCLKSFPGDHLNKEVNGKSPKNILEIKYHPVFENSDVQNPFLVNSEYQNPKIPIILGINSAEGLNEAILHFKIFQNMSVTERNKKFDEELPLMLESVGMQPKSLPNATAKIKKFYFNSTKGILTEKSAQNYCNLVGDIFRSIRMIDTAKEYPGKKYFYVYNYKNTLTPLLKTLNTTENYGITGAAHEDELVSLFSTSVTDKLTIADQKLSEKMIKYWVNFISTGNPNKNEITETKWKPMTLKSFKNLNISKEKFRMDCFPLEELRYKFWKKL